MPFDPNRGAGGYSGNQRNTYNAPQGNKPNGGKSGKVVLIAILGGILVLGLAIGGMFIAGGSKNPAKTPDNQQDQVKPSMVEIEILNKDSADSQQAGEQPQ